MDPFFSTSKQDSLNIVLLFVSKEYKIPLLSVYSKKRSSDVSKARFVLWYILHKEFRFSTPELAKEFKKQPSSIHHGIKFVDKKGIGREIIKQFYDRKQTKTSKKN